MPQIAPTPILLNPAAGGRRAVAARRRLEAGLAACAVPANIHELDAAKLIATARALREVAAPVVAVAGGDGTLRAVAEVLAGGATALAVIPTGTVNSFARRLGIAGVDDALDALAGGCVKAVPVGVVDDQVFLNTATFGQYATVVRRRERLRRYIGKWPAASVAFARAVRRIHPVSLAIDMPEGTLERDSPLLWVGLGRASFPRVRANDAPLDAADLEIVLAAVSSRLAAFAFLNRIFLRALRGRSSAHDSAIEVLHTTHLVIRAPGSIEATLDGEVFRFHAPVAVSIQRAALHVIVPGE